MMEVTSSTEILVSFYKTIQQHILEGSNLYALFPLKIIIWKSPPETSNIQKMPLSYTNKTVQETYIAKLLQEVSHNQAAHPCIFLGRIASNSSRIETGCGY
jgi:hypothetical protein